MNEIVEFENKEMFAPGDMVEHLKRRYGDIDSLPSEDNRIGHIPYVIEVDTNAD